MRTSPGPTIACNVGDTVRVHFRNFDFRRLGVRLRLTTRRVLAVGIAAVAMLMSACSADGSAEEPNGSRTVELIEREAAGAFGTATLADSDGSTRVEIQLPNAPGRVYAAHIHAGTCEQLGEVEYPLEPVEDGTSEKTVPASLAVLSGATDAPFAIDVHGSADDGASRGACGTLSRGLPPPQP